ncbi:hypothetical protein AGMMS49942_22150 [Spirochaetia bacterium]|nr:hypothetical protein AGMMS49942_22150 [Spirochaetia bacterium]
MGTVLATRGVIPLQELPQARASKAASAQAAAVKQFESTLPGNRKPIRSMIADLERVSLAMNRRLKFEVDHESHDVTVKVIDGETDKVIKVLPPEELQRLHDNIRETIGFLFDERV